MRDRVSQKSLRFTESVIREMTRLAARHGAVNLSQGFPDFPAPDAVKAGGFVGWPMPAVVASPPEQLRRAE